MGCKSSRTIPTASNSPLELCDAKAYLAHSRYRQQNVREHRQLLINAQTRDEESRKAHLSNDLTNHESAGPQVAYPAQPESTFATRLESGAVFREIPDPYPKA